MAEKVEKKVTLKQGEVNAGKNISGHPFNIGGKTFVQGAYIVLAKDVAEVKKTQQKIAYAKKCGMIE